MKNRYSFPSFLVLSYLFVCLSASGQQLRFARVYSNLTQNYIASIAGLQTDLQGNYIMSGSVSGYYGSEAIYFGSDSFVNSATAFVSSIDSTGRYNWAIQAGTGLNDPFGGGNIPAIVCDKQNRIYLLGNYDSATTVADTIIRGVNGYNAFLARLSTDGSLMWVKNIVASGEFYPTGLHEDRFGNLLVTGVNENNATFGSTALSTYIVLAKFDSAGTQLWAKSYGGYTGLGYGEQGNSISTDYSGNIYLAGLYRNLADRFDSVILAMPTGNSNLSEYAGFTAKFSPDGECQWAKTNGSFAVSIATDSAGNSYTAGNGQGAFDTANTYFYNRYCFICKYNTNGYLEFVKMDSTDPYALQNVTSLALDQYGNCYGAGFKVGEFHLDSMGTGAGCHPNNEYDAFLLALDPAGRVMWLTSNCNSSALGTAIVVNKCNVAYAGVFENYNDTSAFQIDGVTVPDYPRDSNGHSNADFFLASFDTCGSAYVDTAHSPLAVRDISGLERISIYPNPAMESCTISISNYSGGKYNVSISDMTGQEVSPVFIFTDSHFTFPVSQYNQGMYLLKITAANGEETLRKLVIN